MNARNILGRSLLLGVTMLGMGHAHADDLIEQLFKRVQEVQATSPAVPAASASAVAGLDNQEIVRALREALGQGTRQAVSQLGRDGGYLNDANVKIPMPASLQKAEKVLRTLRQDKYADAFVATLNHAAEKAAPEAAAIFADAIGKMSVEDARAILQGPQDAATRYFRKTGEEKLRAKFLPVIQQATQQAGVTAAYKKLVQKAGPMAGYLGKDATDLDGYVAGEALDGLFFMVAEEEKRIHQDPVARGSELLKKVFGAAAKPQ